MENFSTYVGLDVHKESIDVVVSEPDARTTCATSTGWLRAGPLQPRVSICPADTPHLTSRALASAAPSSLPSRPLQCVAYL